MMQRRSDQKASHAYADIMQLCRQIDGGMLRLRRPEYNFCGSEAESRTDEDCGSTKREGTICIQRMTDDMRK